MSDQLAAARRAPMNRLQRMALRLSTMPMVAGLLSLGAWTYVQADPLLFIGYGCLVLGVMLSLIVPFVLLRAFAETPNVRNTVGISLLAVANLAVTFVCAVEGTSRATRYRLTLANEASTPWLGVQLVGPGVAEAAVTVGPEERSVRDMWFSSDGSLMLQYTDGGQLESVQVEGYVTRNLGGEATVRRDPDGEVHVEVR